MSCAEMAEPINLLFGLWTRMGRKKHEFNRIHQVAPMCPHGRAHSRHHTIEPSACGGDAFLCQITLTTCFFCMRMKYLGNGWTYLCQIHTEDVFGPSPSLGWVWMSRSKVKVTRNKKRTVHCHHPPTATEWNALAANNVAHQQTAPFRRCWWGWSRRLTCSLCLVKHL